MFQELYYWLSTRLAKTQSNKSAPLNAFFLIGILQMSNIVTVYMIINSFAKMHFTKNANICIGLSLATVLAIINHLTLFRKRKEIFKKFDKQSQKRKSNGLIFFWSYVTLSIIIFFVIAAILNAPKK